MKKERRAKLLVVILLASIFIFIGSANAFAYDTTVFANQLWQNSGVYVYSGETVAIGTYGKWAIGNNYFGPNGTSVYSKDTFLYEAYRGQLIAYIGTDPYQGHWGDRNFFPQHTGSGYWAIGIYSKFISNRSGYLWLGFNDDAVTKNIFDNSGSIYAFFGIKRILKIDIMPNKALNEINLRSNKNVPVAIYGSSNFDVGSINRSSVNLQGANALPKYRLKDINGDGFVDLILYFDTKSFHIDHDKIIAKMYGNTTSGRYFEGCDKISIVKGEINCK